MGGQLIYSNLPGADSSRINTCLAFLGEELVTGNDHGELVVWRGEPYMPMAQSGFLPQVVFQVMIVIFKLCYGATLTPSCLSFIK